MKTLIIFLFIVSNLSLAQSNWQPLNGPGGSNVNTIFKVTDSIYLIGVQFDGSIFRTTDSGANWEKVFQGTPYYSNKAVRAFAFNSIGEILASTFQYGILRSTNLGLTWIRTNAGGGEGMTNTTSGIMFGYDNVTQNWTLTTSNDSGRTWSYLSHPWSDALSIYSITSVRDTVFLGFRDSIIYSSDFGNSWNKFGHSFSAGAINSILFLGEGEVLAGTNNGVYYTSDAGSNWVLRNTGIPGQKLVRGLQINSDRIYGIGKFGLIYTTDKGISWNHYNNLSFQKEIYAAAYSVDLILIAAYTGVFRVIPEDWIYSSKGINGYSPGAIANTFNNKLYYNTPSGLFTSYNSGVNWEFVEHENFFDGCKSMAFKENHHFVFANSSLFYHSSDYGNNWVNTGGTNYDNSVLAFSKIDNGLYATFTYFPSGSPPTYGLYYSNNFGLDWNRRSSFLFSLFSILSGDTIISKLMDGWTFQNLGMQISLNKGSSWTDMNTGLPDKNVTSFAVDNFGDYYASLSSGIYKASKLDRIWHQLSDSSMSGVISFDSANHLIVIKSGKIYGSVNGKKWDYCSDGIDDKSISRLIYDEFGYFYLADNTGRLYKSMVPHIINKFPSRPELSYPINNQLVTSDTIEFKWNSSSPLVYNYSFKISSDSLFAGSVDSIVTDTALVLTNLNLNSKYYWKVKAQNVIGMSEESEVSSFVLSLTGVEDEHIFVTKFDLSQNYPNPFNPNTKISWQSPVSGHQSLKVYDVLGNSVSTLVDEYKSAGSYEVNFDASSLSSGVYFYQLRAGEFIETKRMILLK